MRQGWKRNIEAKAKISKSVKKLWTKPSFRNNIIPKLRVAAKAQWANPVMRKRALRILRSKKRRDKLSASLLANSRGPHQESSLEGSVVNWARKHSILAFKLDPKHFAGAPDRAFLIPNSKPIFIEFKKFGGRHPVTKIQKHVHRQIKKAGYDIRVCNNKTDAIEILDTAQRAAKRR